MCNQRDKAWRCSSESRWSFYFSDSTPHRWVFVSWDWTVLLEFWTTLEWIDKHCSPSFPWKFPLELDRCRLRWVSASYLQKLAQPLACEQTPGTCRSAWTYVRWYYPSSSSRTSQWPAEQYKSGRWNHLDCILGVQEWVNNVSNLRRIEIVEVLLILETKEIIWINRQLDHQSRHKLNVLLDGFQKLFFAWSQKWCQCANNHKHFLVRFWTLHHLTLIWWALAHRTVLVSGSQMCSWATFSTFFTTRCDDDDGDDPEETSVFTTDCFFSFGVSGIEGLLFFKYLSWKRF